MKRKRESVDRRSSKKGKFASAVKQAIKEAIVGGITGGSIGAAKGALSGAVSGAMDSNTPSKKGRKITRSYKVKGKGKYKSKKGSRNRKGKKKHPSHKEIIKKGISVRFEKTKVYSPNAAEAVMIAHTSMPVKFSAFNMWRAIVKYLMVRAGLHIKDYGAIMVNEGFVANDVVKVNYYDKQTDTSVTSYSVTIVATMTYDALSFELAKAFQQGSTDNRLNDRLDSIEFVPYAGTAFTNASKIAACNVELNTLKITVESTSKLKIQNMTIQTTGDNEADDVDRVPLQGKIFEHKGNNCLRKSNGAILEGLFSQYNDEALAANWTRQDVTTSFNLDYYADNAGANNANTVFLKPAEVPNRYEFENCLSEQYITCQPGSIHTSYLKQKYTFSLNFYWKLLYATGSSNTDKLVYDQRCGKTKSFYLEKVVGRKNEASNVNNIKLAVELEGSQNVLIHGGWSNYCTPIQYQVNYDP